MTANPFKKGINALASKWFLLILAGLWIIYYVTSAIWSKETFTKFVYILGNNVFVQAYYVLFLFSALLNLVNRSIHRYRHSRLLFFLWILLPLGLLLFLTGFFISSSFRHHEKQIVGEGKTVKPYWQEESYVVSDIRPSLFEEMLDTDLRSIIFQYEPKVTIESEGGPVDVGIFPPKKIGDTYFHILNFGMAPGVILSKGEKTLREGYLIQRILPPGVQDEFDLPPYPYTFFIRMTPDRIVTKGRAKAKVYNLKSPSYEVTVKRGQEVIFEGKSGEGVEFDGLKLSFKDPTYWVLLEMSKDPGVFFILCGLAVIAAGIPLALLRLLIQHSGRFHR